MKRTKEQVKAANDEAVLRAKLQELDRQIEVEVAYCKAHNIPQPFDPFKGWTPKMEQLLQEQERLMGTR